MLEVLPVGSLVRIGRGADAIDGTVTAVTIRGDDHVTYEVVWWDGRVRYAEWLERFEFRATKDGERAGIGFGGG